VDYQGYDARGHAGRKVDGANDLRFTYERAERLTQIATGAGTLLKAFTFGSGTSAADRSLGKVKTAARYNYPAGQTAVFTDTYTYGGLGGRVSIRETALTYNGASNERWNLGLAYDQLGEVTSLTYPDCAFAACPPSPRTVTYSYDEGRLGAVAGYAASVTYHLNGMVNQVTHASPNGVIDTVSVGTDSMLRPTAIDAKKGAATIWSSGAYSYDGAGNVKQIGGGLFQSDPVSRLLSGTVHDGATGGGAARTQGYRFDAFGNITRITTNGAQVQTPTAAATNRLTGGTYDTAGNLTAWNGQSYQFDAFNQMTRFCATTPCPGAAGEEWLYMYDANDERIWSFKWGASRRFDRWSLRGLGGEVLREYANAGYAFTDKKDYIHRDGQLLASVSSLPAEGTRHFHLDHLGTPRAITSASGALLSYHAYYPFGQEATSPIQDAERMKFTGHERDLGSLAGIADDLDSMHARFCSPLTGRFLSVDPLSSANEELPQSWNRYSYAWGNPIRNVDRDGRETGDFSTPPSERSRPPWAGDGGGYQPPRTTSQALKDIALTAGAASSLAGGELAAANLPRIIGFLLRPEPWQVGSVIVGGLTDQPTSTKLGDLGEVSKNALKHLEGHLASFQALDRTATVKDLVALGQTIASNAANLVGKSGERSVFEAIARIGGQSVKVRVVLNPAGRLRTVYIVR
jgi:RHS repeat-associated protein